jgi:hypothetical protein
MVHCHHHHCSLGNKRLRLSNSLNPSNNLRYLLTKPTHMHLCSETYARSTKGRPSNRCQKFITQEVNLAVALPPATPEYLDWSGTSITFNREDFTLQVPRPGHSALVLEAQIDWYEMVKVHMNGGSRINLILANTLHTMNHSLTSIVPTNITFHGIVPGKPILP